VPSSLGMWCSTSRRHRAGRRRSRQQALWSSPWSMVPWSTPLTSTLCTLSEQVFRERRRPQHQPAATPQPQEEFVSPLLDVVYLVEQGVSRCIQGVCGRLGELIRFVVTTPSWLPPLLMYSHARGCSLPYITRRRRPKRLTAFPSKTFRYL
jgi:hypothetical protein